MNENQSNNNLPNISLENSNSADSGEKRGRGRPKKTDTFESTLVNETGEKRGRGRPKKEVTETAPAETGEKRGRGRPKKEDSYESTLVSDLGEKRGRGRPKKETTVENNTNETGEKRGRGRPRKEDTAPSLNDEPKAFAPIKLAGKPDDAIIASNNFEDEEDEESSFNFDDFDEEDDEDANDILTSLDPYSYYKPQTQENVSNNAHLAKEETEDELEEDLEEESYSFSSYNEPSEPAESEMTNPANAETAEVEEAENLQSTEETEEVYDENQEPTSEETFAPAMEENLAEPEEATPEYIAEESEPETAEVEEPQEPEVEQIDPVAVSEDNVRQAEEELAELERKQAEQVKKELEKKEEERRKAEAKRLKAEKKAEKKRIRAEKRRIRAEKRKLKPRVYSPAGVIFNLLFTALGITYIVLECLDKNPLSKILKDWWTNSNGLETVQVIGKFLYISLAVLSFYFALFMLVYLFSHFKKHKWIGGILTFLLSAAIIVLPHIFISASMLSLDPESLADKIFMHTLIAVVSILLVIPVLKVSTMSFALQFKKRKLIKKQTLYSCFVVNTLEQTLYASLIAITYFTKLAYSSNLLVVMVCNILLFVFISLLIMFNLSLLSKKNNTVNIFSIIKNLKGAISESNKLSNVYVKEEAFENAAPQASEEVLNAEMVDAENEGEYTNHEAEETTDETV